MWTTYSRVSRARPPKVSENQNPKRPSSLPTSMLCSSASSDSWSHLSTLPLKNSPAVMPASTTPITQLPSRGRLKEAEANTRSRCRPTSTIIAIAPQ